MTVTEMLRSRVKEVREARGLSLRGLADRVQELGHTLDASGLMRLERGDRRATVDDLIAVAIALDVTPDALIASLHDGDKIEVPGLGERPIHSLRDWWCGRSIMLPNEASQDENMARKQRWLSQRPLYEQRALQREGVATLMAETHRYVQSVGRTPDTSGSWVPPGTSRGHLEAIRAAVDLLLAQEDE